MGFIRKSQKAGVSSGSMADIAFLLLIFFLVTTTIASDKGIYVQLPPKPKDVVDLMVKERNILNIQLNSMNQLLLDSENAEVFEIKDKVIEFVSNNGKDEGLSESPQKAIVSIKTDRGTSYESYISVLDEVKKAYNEMRAAYLGLTLSKFLSLDKKGSAEDKELYDKARKAFPYQVSDAEPSDFISK